MPHDNRSYFHVEQGKPWKYAEFTAPYDFPIYKSEAVINEERDSAMRQFEPYFEYDKDIELRMVNKFNTDYAEGIPGLPESFVGIMSNRLHRLYQQGIMEQEEYINLHSDTTRMIRVVSGKEAVSISINDVYSAKAAYEQLFTEEQLAILRPMLQKCDLNAYIVPNLIYDRDRSETSKNDLLSGIALASGLVLKGQKIVDRGEIVTEKTYRIIESFK
ncbi:MAG: hydrolase, partial [Prevotella sp.]|nr:hydrolase [Prevotella sp.]